MALGVVLVIAAVIGGLVLLGRGDDDDEAGPEPIQSLNDARAGISLQWPGDWANLEKGGRFVFRSPDGMVVLTISAPAAASDAARVRKGIIAATTEVYRNPMVGPGRDRKIGGLESAGAVISGRGPHGPSRTLVAVAAGETKAYLLELYVGAGADQASLAGAQLILNSLELSK
jgi:hypothetical protein